MNPISALIASTGLCSSRAFLPAFIAAVLLRLGADHQVVREAAGQIIGAGSVRQVATWFTSNISLTILGALATLELAGASSQEARSVLAEIDHWGKPLMAVVTMFGLMSQSDANFATQVSQQQAGVFTSFLAMCAAFGTYVVSVARNETHRLFHDADSENSTGVHGLIAWGEDLWAGLGMALFVFFPILMAGLIGLVIGVILLLQRRARRREEAAKVGCGTCGVLMYRSAFACPSCRTASASPSAINWLGVATVRAADPERHAIDLVTKRRCPSCATRLTERTARQACAACSTTVFGDAEAVSTYDAAISSRLPATLIITAAMGLVPIFGLVAGVIFYRLYLIAPYRAYLPRTKSILLRWGLRGLLFVLVLLHLVPVIGALAGPFMALLNYVVYRGAFLGEASVEEVGEESPRSGALQPA